MRKAALNLFIVLLYYELRSHFRTVNSEPALASVFSNPQLSRAEWRVKETMGAKYFIGHRPSTFGTYHPIIIEDATIALATGQPLLSMQSIC